MWRQEAKNGGPSGWEQYEEQTWKRKATSGTTTPDTQSDDSSSGRTSIVDLEVWSQNLALNMNVECCRPLRAKGGLQCASVLE